MLTHNAGCPTSCSRAIRSAFGASPSTSVHFLTTPSRHDVHTAFVAGCVAIDVTTFGCVAAPSSRNAAPATGAFRRAMSSTSASSGTTHALRTPSRPPEHTTFIDVEDSSGFEFEGVHGDGGHRAAVVETEERSLAEPAIFRGVPIARVRVRARREEPRRALSVLQAPELGAVRDEDRAGRGAEDREREAQVDPSQKLGRVLVDDPGSEAALLPSRRHREFLFTRALRGDFHELRRERRAVHRGGGGGGGGGGVGRVVR
eukprot:31042-Pelagococcus_subviridis.AAC.5